MHQSPRNGNAASMQRAQDASGERLRVALLTNEIPPYRVPLYRELAADDSWDFKVFTCVERENDRLWNVESAFPFPTRRSCSFSYTRTIRRKSQISFNDVRQIHLPVGLLPDLYRFRPDVVISSEFGARTLLAAIYAKLRRCRLITYFEGTPHTEQDLTRAQRWLRPQLRRLPHAYLVNGQQGREYLESLGVSSPSIFEIGQAIDTDSFATPLSDQARNTLRGELGIHGHAYLFCGRLIPLKGLEQLLDAWTLFSKQVGDGATLVLAGDGTDRTALEDRVKQASLTNVRFLGHLQRDRLPDLYRAVDVLVFPALVDCWALVVGEAMASGLPVINSIYTGSRELTIEGETGWVVDPFNASEMVQKLHLAWQARHQKDVIRDKVQRKIAHQDVTAVSARIQSAVGHVYYSSR